MRLLLATTAMIAINAVAFPLYHGGTLYTSSPLNWSYEGGAAKRPSEAFMREHGANTAQLATVPEGHRIASESWEIVDGVAVQSVETEPIPEPEPEPMFDPFQWEVSWPLLSDHPDTNDIPEGGMAYRLDGDPITWWVVRQGDLESTQISAHDDAGEPIYRSRNLATGTERTIHVGQLERAANMALAPLLADLTANEVLERISVFPEWRAGVPVTIGEHFRHDGKAYRVVQAHTTQAHWTPSTVPALFVEVAPPGTIPDWSQPDGAHDAYQIGDRVEHAGSVWESTIAANTVEPGTHPGFDWWVEVTD